MKSVQTEIAEAISDAIVDEKMEEELTMSQYEEIKTNDFGTDCKS